MRQNFTYESNLILKDAGLVAVSGAAQVSAAAKIVDLGGGFVEGKVVLDVSALEIDTGDESYDIVVLLGEEADFATKAKVVERVTLHLGAKGTKRTDSDADDVAGRYVISFDNLHGTSVYRYMGLYTVVAGTIATGINYTARLTKE